MLAFFIALYIIIPGISYRYVMVYTQDVVFINLPQHSFVNNWNVRVTKNVGFAVRFCEKLQDRHFWIRPSISCPKSFEASKMYFIKLPIKRKTQTKKSFTNLLKHRLFILFRKKGSIFFITHLFFIVFLTYIAISDTLIAFQCSIYFLSLVLTKTVIAQKTT